jgi:hypothetical protein
MNSQTRELPLHFLDKEMWIVWAMRLSVCLSQLPPSALEHPDTALRDPVYYQMLKRMDHFVQKYYDRLPHYTHEEVSVIITDRASGRASSLLCTRTGERCYFCSREQVSDVTYVRVNRWAMSLMFA